VSLDTLMSEWVHMLAGDSCHINVNRFIVAPNKQLLVSIRPLQSNCVLLVFLLDFWFLCIWMWFW